MSIQQILTSGQLIDDSNQSNSEDLTQTRARERKKQLTTELVELIGTMPTFRDTKESIIKHQKLCRIMEELRDIYPIWY